MSRCAWVIMECCGPDVSTRQGSARKLKLHFVAGQCLLKFGTMKPLGSSANIICVLAGNSDSKLILAYCSLGKLRPAVGLCEEKHFLRTFSAAVYHSFIHRELLKDTYQNNSIMLFLEHPEESGIKYSRKRVAKFNDSFCKNKQLTNTGAFIFLHSIFQ